jgi:hypothetical protein
MNRFPRNGAIGDDSAYLIQGQFVAEVCVYRDTPIAEGLWRLPVICTLESGLVEEYGGNSPKITSGRPVPLFQ